MSAVFRREFKTYFTSPLGYVILAVLFVFAGYFFYNINMLVSYTYNSYYQVVPVYPVASLANVFGILQTIVMLLVAPIISMRLFSEDKRQKTDQALFTAPTGLTGIVVGKFLAAVLMFAIGLSITLVYGFIISLEASPDWVVILGNYFGLLMLGSLVIAIGMMFSAMTESQFVAAIGTFAVSLILLFTDSIAGSVGELSWLAAVFQFLSLSTRYQPFTYGLIRYENIVFFLSMQALFVFITVRLLDRKRWG